MILGSSNIQSAPSIVAKIDIDGNINEAFSLIDSFDSTYHYFNFNSIDVWDDSSFIFGARTTYIPDSLGVSKDSRVDFTLIKFSSIDRSVQWVTSVDYKNNLDQEMTTCLLKWQLACLRPIFTSSWLQPIKIFAWDFWVLLMARCNRIFAWTYP